MLYLIQGEYHSKTGKFLIDDDFCIGIKGINYPVLEEVHKKYCWYYSCRICKTYDIEISEEVRKIIDPIIELRRRQSAGALSKEISKKSLKYPFDISLLPDIK